MTGTAKTEEEEFRDIYNMFVIRIPTNKPVIRKDYTDLIFSSEKGKYNAIVNFIKELNEKGQPILVGTISVENNEKHLHYTRKKFDNEYLTFEALESGTFTLTIGSAVTTGDVVSVSYSLDNGETWTTTNNVQGQKVTITTPTVNAGDEVLWKGNAVRMANKSNENSASTFSSTANFNARGNVMSLLYSDDFKDEVSLSGKDYCFYNLFYNNLKLINGKNISLPATTLAGYCYYGMFRDCTSLVTAPVLPATTLATNCYYQMFYGCTSLTTAPELPATNLVPGSTYAGVYSNMFGGCTSLTTAPELPATTLTSRCYLFMFSGCTSLNSITCLATDISANGCTTNWVSGVASSGTFIKAPSMTSWTTGVSGIPDNWAIQDAT
jgi:hypothetical protein